MSSGPELGLATMYRVIKKSGAERVSDDAADELRKILEDVAERIAKRSSGFIKSCRSKNDKI